MAKTWDEIRAFRYSTVAPPPGWPDNVRPISIDGVTLFGIDPATNKLYWDGREIVVRDRLRLGGWSEDRKVHVDYRFAAGRSDQYLPLARELMALQPDVIVAVTTPVAATLQRETQAIPIVFTSVSDPIGGGFVASLARPGGNFTGVLLYEDGRR
jgi:ABC transporter substrate binding protein